MMARRFQPKTLANYPKPSPQTHPAKAIKTKYHKNQRYSNLNAVTVEHEMQIILHYYRQKL